MEGGGKDAVPAGPRAHLPCSRHQSLRGSPCHALRLGPQTRVFPLPEQVTLSPCVLPDSVSPGVFPSEGHVHRCKPRTVRPSAHAAAQARRRPGKTPPPSSALLATPPFPTPLPASPPLHPPRHVLPFPVSSPADMPPISRRISPWSVTGRRRGGLRW